MPRNNKTSFNTNPEYVFLCPCGYNNTSNDMRGHNIIIKIHKRACDRAQKCSTIKKEFNESTDTCTGIIKKVQIK
jgi:hypothetical protein